MLKSSLLWRSRVSGGYSNLRVYQLKLSTVTVGFSASRCPKLERFCSDTLEKIDNDAFEAITEAVIEAITADKPLPS